MSIYISSSILIDDQPWLTLICSSSSKVTFNCQNYNIELKRIEFDQLTPAPIDNN